MCGVQEKARASNRRRAIRADSARRERGNCVHGREALGLAYPLIVAEHKHLVFPDRPSSLGSELIALEWRFLDAVSIVKEICSVQGAVAQELVNASVELIGSRARNGVHHTA